jgi:hypothetical protein
MSVGRAQDILIGPRTTVYGLLRAYPFLDHFLLARVRGFERLHDDRARTRWARIMTLDDVCARLGMPWRQLARAIAAEVERGSGRPPRLADAPARIAHDGRRVGELRGIVDGLEHGEPLLQAAQRWRSATGHLEQAEKAALDTALSQSYASGAAAGHRAMTAAAAAREDAAATLPPGHPLDTLRREAAVVRGLCATLRGQLDRLGGSPSRRRWQKERPSASRLVERLSAVESRFRREQQAWFPALEVHAVDGPRILLAAQQADALEILRRLRLAVDGDDASSVADAGLRLADALEYLLAQDERVLEPLAVRRFSRGDWEAVRELEDGVGWGLVPEPPAWPDS